MPSSGIAVCDGQLDYMCQKHCKYIEIQSVQHMASSFELVHV